MLFSGLIFVIFIFVRLIYLIHYKRKSSHFYLIFLIVQKNVAVPSHLTQYISDLLWYFVLMISNFVGKLE